ncbi:efflux RND transporter periplasmic adaptor subunit [Vibrio sp. WXL210]|uniref:efflux RND transporter periplasmic adaptor subunit n=1 Tax=Vibrio sp. WXL210 TaxID=3450709 RepID=UPI003EC86741
MKRSSRRLLVVAAPLLLVGLVGYRFMTLSAQGTEVASPERSVRIQTQLVEPQPLTAWVFSEGTVQAQRKAFLDFEMSGKVESISLTDDGTQVREGTRVFGPTEGTRNGQLLAQIDNRDSLAGVQSLEARLKSIQAQRSEAQARVQQVLNDQKLAEQNFQRMQEVFARGVISQDEFDKIRTSRLNADAAVKAAESGLASVSSEITSLVAELNRATLSLEKTSLFAPFDGVVTTMNIREDNHYYPPMSGASDREREASSAIVIVDDSQMEVQLEISMVDAKQLSEGQQVILASDDHQLYQAEQNNQFADRVAIGEIWSVSPSINLQRRTQTVKVRVEQANGLLKEGQFVRAWIAAQTEPEALTMPLHALSFRDGQPFVFVFDSNTQQVERRLIQLGLQGTNAIQVTQGLNSGDEVVVRGQHLLIDGASVVKVGAQS